jgi:hypothetical protein
MNKESAHAHFLFYEKEEVTRLGGSKEKFSIAKNRV